MKRGFSLVELSIVLVILGLLTGGILAGQSLIRASELRSLIADMTRYHAAYYTFRDKYFALPGDMTNAQSFWGVRAAGTDTVCQQTISVTTGTCNSDGNGQINRLTGDVTYGERFLAWQHLAYAGLIEGSYTGASNSVASEVRVRGTNVPSLKLGSNGYFNINYFAGPASGHAQYFDGPYNVQLLIALNPAAALISPEEMWNVDTKLDDGKPAAGNIFALKSTSTWMPGCTTSDLVTADYALTTTAKSCYVYYTLR